MGKFIATVVAILLLTNNAVSAFAAFCTSLGDSYPALQKYAAISLAISAFLGAFLPRIQKLGDVFREVQSNL